MRTLTILVFSVACMVPTPPKAEDPAPAATSEADSLASPKATKVVVEDPKANKAPDPILPPPAPPGLEGVDVVGHGLRITMYPPFQVALADDFVAGFVEKGATDGLMLSWWNVADPNVGGRMGMNALYNAGVAVHPVPEGETRIIKGTLTWPDGKTGVSYRLGETGSYVLIPPELIDAGGMLTVAPGPADPSWAMEVDGVRTPLVPKEIVHSADPASGSPFESTGRPHQPWGPWPASAP